VANSLACWITVEQVAFPQSGMLTSPGTAELIEEALNSGVGTAGGIDPAGVDNDPVRHLDPLHPAARVRVWAGSAGRLADR